jgi:hypothetical protein
MTRSSWPRAAQSVFKVGSLLAFLVPISIQSSYLFRQADGWLFGNFSLFSALSKSPRDTRDPTSRVGQGDGIELRLDESSYWAPTDTRYSIYGVRQGDGTELRLDESRYWAPLDLIRIRAALALVARASKDDEGRFLEALMERYRLNAERGRHGGPPLESIRIYRVTYDWTAGVDHPTNKRTLVMER